MTVMSDQQRKELQEIRAEYCVSLFMPTHPTSHDAPEDRIRLKNILNEAQKKLENVGVRSSDAREQLHRGWVIHEDSDFWRNHRKGLVMFFSPTDSWEFLLPEDTPEKIYVQDHFVLTPIADVLDDDRRMYVMPLSPKPVQLFEVTRDSIRPVDLPGAPDDYEQAMRAVDPEHHLEYHSGTSEHDPNTRRPRQVHGQGVGVDDKKRKKRLREFCQKVDDGVSRALSQQRVPLVLVAAEPMAAIYREVSKYPNIAERTIRMNPDIVASHELHKKAVEVMAGEESGDS